MGTETASRSILKEDCQTLRKSIIATCLCGESEDILILAGDKRGFRCNGCGLLFDVDINGNVKKMPLQRAVIVFSNERPNILGRIGIQVNNYNLNLRN